MKTNEVLKLIDALSPATVPQGVTHETHEQCMACVDCGLAGYVPPEHFPQVPGVWDQPCPKCGGTVWVTEVRASAQQ